MVHVGSVQGKVGICKIFLVCFHYLFIEQGLDFKVMLSSSPWMLMREMCIVWVFWWPPRIYTFAEFVLSAYGQFSALAFQGCFSCAYGICYT